MSVLLACTLPATAVHTSVTQCMPAPMSPSHIDLALAGATLAGSDCMATEYAFCAMRASLTFAKRSATAASP
eukprot:1214330-Pleurochrysis_carterae.AAC.1